MYPEIGWMLGLYLLAVLAAMEGTRLILIGWRWYEQLNIAQRIWLILLTVAFLPVWVNTMLNGNIVVSYFGGDSLRLTAMFGWMPLWFTDILMYCMMFTLASGALLNGLKWGPTEDEMRRMNELAKRKRLRNKRR